MKNIKIIFCSAIVLLISNITNANVIERDNTVVKKEIEMADICTITYTVTEYVGSTVTVSEYTISAATCEEVENSAISAGIIKPKKKVSAN